MPLKTGGRREMEEIGMKRNSSPLVFLVLATVSLVGCASPPTELIDAARASVASVGEEGAEYASAAYADAQAAVGRMDAEVAAQAERFALTRNYERATELAGEAEAAADAVGRAIEAEKQRLRGEATRMIGDAEAAIADARGTLGEMAEEETAPLLEDLAGAEASVNAANDALGRDDLNGAHQEAGSALDAAGGVTSALAALAAAAEEAAPEEAIIRAVRGGIDVPRDVYVDGQMLAAGAYTLRLGDGGVPPVAGEGPNSTRWIEFVSDEDGSVAGRGLAAAIPDAEIGEVASGWVPRNQAYVDELRDGEYVRVWLHRDGVTYLVHAPTSAP